MGDIQVKRDRLLKATAALASFLFVAPATYMAFDNEMPYTYLDGVIIPDHAPDGAQVTVDWRIKVNRLCRGAVQRVIVDARGVAHTYDATPAALSVDPKAEHLLRTFTLPLGMPEGETKYRANVCYICNPLQVFWPLCLTTPEIRFHIGGSK